MSFRSKQSALKRKYRRNPLTAPQSRAVAKIAMKQINKVSELKYKDTSATNEELSYDAPYIKLLDMPAQGDTQTTRDGDSIYIKKLFLRAWVKNIGATTVDVPVRVMLVQWLEDNANDTPTLGEVLESAAQYVSINSPYKITDKKKFKVLHDQRFHISEDNGPSLKFLTISPKRLKQRKIQFNAGAVTGVGNIYLIAFSDRTDASDTGPVINFYSRLRYLDN